MKYPIVLYKFKFLFRAKERMNLPSFKGSMFRGAFGWTFKRAVCITRAESCDNCMLRQNCGYFQVFETEIPNHQLDFLTGVKKSPHPFVIEPPLDERHYYEPGDTFEIGTVIFGDAIKYFPFFVYTFQKMGERGIGYKRYKFQLLSVLNIDAQGDFREVFDAKTDVLKLQYEKITENEILSKPFPKSKRLELEFVSPLRIQKLGKIIKRKEELTAEIFYEAMFRRVLSVSHLFCEGKVPQEKNKEISPVRIVENSLQYKNIMRYSNRQKQKMEFGGFLGRIKFEGELGEFSQLAHLTEYLHLGKNTVFGLGKFRIE